MLPIAKNPYLLAFLTRTRQRFAGIRTIVSTKYNVHNMVIYTTGTYVSLELTAGHSTQIPIARDLLITSVIETDYLTL